MRTETWGIEARGLLHVTVQFFHLLERPRGDYAVVVCHYRADLFTKRFEIFWLDGECVQATTRQYSAVLKSLQRVIHVGCR